MPKQEKIDRVAQLGEQVKQSSALVMTDYRGLTVKEISEIRRNLRATGAQYTVVKNTLFHLATKDVMEESISELLAGPTAVAFVESDAIGAAKALVDFAKTHKALEIKGAYMEGKVLDTTQVVALSKIPSREVLISQMLGAFQSPIAGFVGTLQGVVSQFVFTLQAVADQKSAA